MSWSIKVRHGDFVTTGAELAVVTRQDKLLQDLRLWVLEKMGTDPLHPLHGSLIDGGRLPDGTVDPGVIGTNDMRVAAMKIEQDIRRIVQEYQRQQLNRAKSDRLNLGKATLDSGEVLLEITDISFNQNQDSLRVFVTLLSGNREQVELQVPLSSDVSSTLATLA